METYTSLPIHKKINAKANRLVLYGPGDPSRPAIEKIRSRIAGIFLPEKLLLEAPGIHNNRNYDGGEPDYNGWSSAEESERMARIQREIK